MMVSGVEENLPVFKEDPRRERGGGRNYVTLDAGDKHDVLEPFQADVLATRSECERSDAILAGMGVE